MVQAPPRTALSGPALIRLVARLADLDVPESGQSLSDRLSQWLGWTDAIALSTALSGHAAVAATGAREAGDAAQKESTRVRKALAKAVAADGGHVIDADADYAIYRQDHLALQQTMQSAIATLRGRLRTMLAARTPALARLAAVDAVMEDALGAREHNLLATLPGLLGGHFERLRQSARDLQAAAASHAADSSDAGADAATHPPGAWLATFRRDRQSVLLAELDIRLQPVEGLLAALHTR